MNAAIATTDTQNAGAPLALWRIAEAFIHILHALFGAPETIAANDALSVSTHKLLASWLRAGEAMMRRLLLIEAAAYPKSSATPLPRALRTRVRKLMSFTAENPAAWRVSFRCFVSSPARGGSVSARLVRRSPQGEGGRAMTKGARFRSAWPLAERYEALLRAFNAPAAYARRIARRLHAEPQRLREALRDSPEAEHRVDKFRDFTEAVWERWSSG